MSCPKHAFHCVRSISAASPAPPRRSWRKSRMMGTPAIIGHGGTGPVLYCQIAKLPIDRRYDQLATNGGNWFAFALTSRKLLHDGWRVKRRANGTPDRHPIGTPLGHWSGLSR